LTVYETVGGRTPEQRARAIEQRIIALAKEGGTPVATFENHEGWTEILMGGRVIMAVTDTDARMAGVPKEQLVAEYAKTIEEVIPAYRQEHSWQMVLRGVLKALVATLLLVGILWLLRRVRFLLRDQIERWIRANAQVEPKSAWHIVGAYAGSIALGLGAIMRWVVILGLLETYLTVVLSYFSSTRELSLGVTHWVLSQLGSLTRAAVNYLPDLLVVSVIALLAHYAFRLLRLIFVEIGTGKLKIRGFYPDWAEPTEKLLRISPGTPVIFDRSYYNRAGVEYVMGFCTKEQHRRFLELCPMMEKYIEEAGIILLKYWLEVGKQEQERRFEARIKDPLRQWKLSPMDLESFSRWYDYSKARDMMLKATDSKHAPWTIVRSDSKRKARLNCISDLLSRIPYKKAPQAKVKLPPRSNQGSYDDQATLKARRFVTERY
jgi:Polyphosphate kinase 2 (PPK2)